MKKKRINSKNKGTAYELKIINELKKIYETDEIYSTRNINRKLDGEKVDVVGDCLQFNIQAKAQETNPRWHDIFNLINRTKPPVIFWKKNFKTELVVIEKEEFYNILNKLKNN